MTPQTTAGAVKPDWTITEFWRRRSRLLRWHIPQAAPTQRAPQPRLRCTTRKGCSPDAR